jgi:tetratricopeptide (TPR) repeat protein
VQTNPLLLLLLVAATARGEIFTGRLLTPAGAAPHRLRVLLVPAGEKNEIKQTKPGRGGDFSLTCAAGSYFVEVLNRKGRLMHRLPVQVPSATTLEIDLRPSFEPHTTAGLVSARRLRHKIPAKALQHLAAAHDAALEGDAETAIRHLEAALILDPNYFEALNNLAVHYTNLNRLNEAKALLERATALEPDNALAELNLTLLSVRLGHTASARQLAIVRRLLPRLQEQK